MPKRKTGVKAVSVTHSESAGASWDALRKKYPRVLEAYDYVTLFESRLSKQVGWVLSHPKMFKMSEREREEFQRDPGRITQNWGVRFVLCSMTSFLVGVLENEDEWRRIPIKKRISAHLGSTEQLPDALSPLFKDTMLSAFKPGTIRQVKYRLRRGEMNPVPPKIKKLVQVIVDLGEDEMFAYPRRIANELKVSAADTLNLIDQAKRIGFDIREHTDSGGRKYFTAKRRRGTATRYK